MAILDFNLRHRQLTSEVGERVHVLLQYRNDLASLQGLGFQVSSVAGDVAAGSIPSANLDELAGHPEVVHIESSRTLKDETDVSSVALNLVDPSTGRRNVPGGGRGAIVGIIDSGFDLTHPCFNSGLGTTRILAAWDQVNTTKGVEPDGFDYGVEYTREVIDQYAAAGKILITKSTSLGGPHGTAVAGIAAGNGKPDGIFRGVAPEADLVLVTYKNDVPIGGSAFVLDAIRYIQQQACGFVRPVVINLSVGDDLGPHDGTSLLERAIDNLVEQGGLLIVKSAGNSGQRPAQRHARGKVIPGRDFALPFALTISATKPVDGDTIEVWYSGGDRFAVALKSPGGYLSDFVAPGENREIPFPTGAKAYVYSDLDHPTNGDNRIGIVFQKDPGWEAGTWQLILRGEVATHGNFDAWADRPNTVTSVTFKRYQTVATTVTIPGNARRVITVGGFVSRPTESGDTGEVKGTLWAASSMGPTRDGRIKPDLTAPASLISAPRIRKDGCWGEAYEFNRGTSMSAPHVTGAIALLWALWPELTSEQIRKTLFCTAREDAFTGATPNARWGYGKLDVRAAYEVFSTQEGNGEKTMGKRRTCEFQLALRRKTGRKTTVTVQIDIDGDQAVGIRGLDARGANIYDVSFSVRKKGSTKGGDECYECKAPSSPCPPNALTEVACGEG